ncbi:MAG: DMT family transporter [Flavobacteriales bacterium]
MSDNLKAHLSLFAANLIYGANYSIAKEVMPDYIQPFGFILIRVLGALFLFAVIFSIWKREKIHREDLKLFALCGLTGVAINQLMFFKGLSMTSPIEAAIILTANPVMVLIAAAVIAGQKISWNKLAGIFLALSGALILILQQKDFSISESHTIGNLFILINAASYAVYLVIVQPLMQKYKPGTVMLIVFSFGLLYVLPFGWSEMQMVNWGGMPVEIWLAVVFIVVGTTYLAYLFNSYGLSKLSPSVVSVYIYLQPLFASLVAIGWGKDRLDLEKLISAILVFAGIYLTTVRGEKKRVLEK